MSLGSSLTYRWDSGDVKQLTSSTSETFQHVYTLPGIFTVTLTVSNPLGEVVVEYTVTVQDPITGTRHFHVLLHNVMFSS